AVERALKMAIRHRRNSLFFRTQHGAYIGDLFMSLIHTCRLSKINPFDYLVALQRHTHEVFKNPEKWLPWNYEAAMIAAPP
ncbi:MAG: IS66 family transposase, partial [Syntrophorhabdales bacterium]